MTMCFRVTVTGFQASKFHSGRCVSESRLLATDAYSGETPTLYFLSQEVELGKQSWGVSEAGSAPTQMYTKLARSDQRVKLWIDNKLMVDQWSSLSGAKVYGTIVFGDAYSYYRILME